MAKQSGLGDRFYLGGYDLSGDISTIDNHGGPAAMDVTGIDKQGNERIGGIKDGDLTWTSWFNPSGAHAQLSTLPTTSRVGTYLRGVGLGLPGCGLVGKQVNYQPKRANGGALTIAVNLQGSDGSPLEWGTQLTAGVRTDAAPTTGAAVDNAAPSTYGAAFYLHTSAVVGTSCQVKVQSSPDNTTWTDLVTFGAVAAGAYAGERQAIAGTVARYLRVVSLGTFTSASFVLLGCRLEAAA